MLNIGPQELLVVLIIALVVVGPQRLPELGRSIGKALREFRKIQDDVKDTLRFDLNPEPEPYVAPRPSPNVDANGSSASPDVQPLVVAEPALPAPADDTVAPDPQDRPAPDAEPPAAG
ncbi:MAG: Sec-independent protein translocase protein TatB [Actinomycetota bacterium]